MRRLPATLALGAALLTACGDEENNSTTKVVANGDTVRVVAEEYSFEPDNVVYEAEGSRARITIELDNRGSLAHNVKVFDGQEQLGGTPSFPAGRQESGTVELGPGRYRMVCTVGDHEQLGMRGTIEVR